MEYVIKRDGRKVEFNKEKIINAVYKATNALGSPSRKISELTADIVVDKINNIYNDERYPTVEEIQNLIEDVLMNTGHESLAKKYITYRYKRTLVRNTTDQTIEELLDGKSEYWNTENSNKDTKTVTTMRDYIAGITSTDISRRLLLPQEVIEAHDKGIIHFHDMDYFAQPISNCELINLEDMLQNGTIINGVMIEKPHRFLTACTIATQIILGVSSATYGGATITLTHLAPFVRYSYQKYLSVYQDRGLPEKESIKFAKEDIKREIEAGVQTFNYQVNSMTNTNGQAPFLSVCMYLGETEEYKKELALIIEEFLKQRILGFKNEKGVYITPAFPKLLYVLEEDNIHKNSKYYYLTQLAARCTEKRMVPDYISEKVMKKNKINKHGDGNCYPCMGCRSFLTPWTTNGNPSKALNYEKGKGKYYGRLTTKVKPTLNCVNL